MPRWCAVAVEAALPRQCSRPCDAGGWWRGRRARSPVAVALPRPATLAALTPRSPPRSRRGQLPDALSQMRSLSSRLGSRG
jgi:hypothetical protein